MRRSKRRVWRGDVGAVILSLVCGAVGCGPTAGSRAGGGGSQGGAPFDLGAEADAAVDPSLDMTWVPPCVGLECQQVSCPAGSPTRVTGKTYDPAGTTPLYNVIVYVPNAALAPFSPGVTCDACGALASGSPVVAALSESDGTFVLDDVPAGDNIPLVIQVGRWRRQVTLPHVEGCQTLTLTDPNVTRLPRDKSEGDIPLIAIATGSADPFECLLRKVGIADSEFTVPTGTGRVHFYRQNGKNMNPSAPAASALWSDLATLKQYDMVILPCEASAQSKSSTAKQNLVDYTSAGGRVFATHYSYVWIAQAPAPFPSVASWHLDQSFPSDPLAGSIDTSFPKGQAFASWLSSVGASSVPGQLSIQAPRHDVDAVNSAKAQRWISGTAGHSIVEHMTFNTPVEPIDGGAVDDGGVPIQCGRVVYSDFHVSTNALDSTKTYFPEVCKTGATTAQEKALEFMLFDLSACVQKDSAPPEPPIY